MSLQNNKFKRLLVLLGIMVIPVFLLSIHLFVLSKADLKTEPKEVTFPPEQTQIVEVDVMDLDISGNTVYEKTGLASYYADKFHQRTTASGEKFNMYEFSAAHKSLPFGTILRVTNTSTNKSTLVRINDRGPYVGSRILDLSKKSALAIGSVKSGTAKVKIEGFLAGNKKEVINENYVYAYSLNHKPVCVPYDIFEKVDSTKVFNNAVTILKNISKNAVTNEDYYLIQNPVSAKNGIKYRDYFYIVRLKELHYNKFADNFKI
jgi:rare lipoprotein A